MCVGGGGETYLCLDNFRASVGLFLKRACTLLSGLSCCSSVLVLMSIFCVVSVVFPICCDVAVVSVLVFCVVSVVFRVCCDVVVESVLAFNAAISGDI